MEKSTFLVGEYTVSIFYPYKYVECPIIYTQFSEDMAEATAGLLDDTNVILVAIDGVNWEQELTPWPAHRAFRGGNDFSGGADTYLKKLTDNIVPAVEAKLGLLPWCRAIGGYSLAGLFSIYTLYRTDIFNCAASVSGSLWYDKFLDFMKNNRPNCLPERVYFSLGDCEKKVRNQRLATVESCTAEAEKLMRNLGAKTVFKLNSGNHFSNVPERFAKGIRWICSGNE